MPEITILQLIYQQKAYEGHAKDYESSGTSMGEHWQSGYEDTKRTLRRKDWLAMPPHDSGIVVHDVHREDAWLPSQNIRGGASLTNEVVAVAQPPESIKIGPGTVSSKRPILTESESRR
jgi:hypothetical protein